MIVTGQFTEWGILFYPGLAIVGIFAVLLMLFAWVLNPICQKTNKTIYKGLHRPLLQIPLCVRFFKNKGLYVTKNIIFDETCITNHKHTNKIYGFTVGGLFEKSIHENSFRFGWRCDQEKIMLVAYYYINSIRYMKDLREIDLDKTYAMTLHRSENEIVWNTYVVGENGHDDKKEFKVSFENKKESGYMCGLYYGGEPSAPHTIKIRIW